MADMDTDRLVDILLSLRGVLYIAMKMIPMD